MWKLLTTQTSDEAVLIHGFPKSCSGVLWDCAQSNVFVAFDEKTCFTFIYVRHSVEGKKINFQYK